jgi:hypothetical protein
VNGKWEVASSFANYTAEFKKWTKIPFVGVFYCSDKVTRTIPLEAVVGNIEKLPNQFKDK